MSNPKESTERSQTDISSGNKLNGNETEQTVTPSNLDEATAMEPTLTTEHPQIGMSSINELNTKKADQKMTRCTQDESTSSQKTEPTDHSQIDMSCIISSPLEPTAVETTENPNASNVEEIPLIEKPQNVVMINTASDERPSNDEKKLCCDNSSAQKCLSYSLHFLQLCLNGVKYYGKYYFNGLQINGEERVEHNPLEIADFKLSEDIKVANYSEKDLKKHWNVSMMRPTLKKWL